MSGCPFFAPGRQEACLSLQKSREAAMTRDYDRNDCFVCPMRRKRIEGAKEPERINIPPANHAARSPAPIAMAVPRETPQPEPSAAPSEEASVIDDKARERVFSRISREKECSRSRLMNYCGVAKGELEEIASALLAEGKIKAWPKGTGALYTLPDAKDPRTKEMVEGTRPAPKKKAPPAARAVPAAPKAAAPTAKPAPKNGSGAYASVISDLEAERTKVLDRVEQIDTAIATLRALA